jgi:hypothetical protein
VVDCRASSTGLAALLFFGADPLPHPRDPGRLLSPAEPRGTLIEVLGHVPLEVRSARLAALLHKRPASALELVALELYPGAYQDLV